MVGLCGSTMTGAAAPKPRSLRLKSAQVGRTAKWCVHDVTAEHACCVNQNAPSPCLTGEEDRQVDAGLAAAAAPAVVGTVDVDGQCCRRSSNASTQPASSMVGAEGKKLWGRTRR